MSHAANLRSIQRAQEVSKTRKLSENGSQPSINGVNGISHKFAPSNLTATPSKDIKGLKRSQADVTNAKIGNADSNARLTQGPPDVISISSGELESEDGEGSEGSDDDAEDESDEADETSGRQKHGQKSQGSGNDSTKVNGVHTKLAHSKQEPLNAGNDFHDAEERATGETRPRLSSREQSAEQAEPSFGDLLRSRQGTMVDIGAQSEGEERSRSIPQRPAPSQAPGRALATLNANSLGTVLSQALRTNDAPMLESCLQVGNLQNIRATIERLPSQQAGELLQRLADRMYRRPGRAGSLMVWIQWTVVAHGGYLATQPAVMSQLRELYRVVKMRANALPPLLALKGKLDMLEAQLQLRRNRAERSSQSQGGRSEGIIYIEGESSDDVSEDEVGNADTSEMQPADPSSKPNLHRGLTFETDNEADDEPMTNGVPATTNEDDEQDDSSDDDEDLIDDEAESTSGDEDVSEEEVDVYDLDGPEGSDSDEREPASPRKRRRR